MHKYTHAQIHTFSLHVQIREFLEKHYAETSGRGTIKLAIRALMETVEAGSKSIEVGGVSLCV